MFDTSGIDGARVGVGSKISRRCLLCRMARPRPLVSWQTALHYTANHTEFVCVGQRSRRVRFMCSWCHDVTLIIDWNA